jgi:hypothetical protein
MMDSFQKKVLGVAGIIFILTLLSTIYLLSSGKKSMKWPPSVPQCPDYFVYDTALNVCLNKKKLGTNPTLQFNPAEKNMVWNSNNATCNLSDMCCKYKVGKYYQIPWDGVTYGNGTDPCNERNKS